MSEYYREVPVDEARKISSLYLKHLVIIFAWDDAHKLLHTTTYGSTPHFKIAAARGGEIAAQALGFDLEKTKVISTETVPQI
jgi:hypothetical protein